MILFHGANCQGRALAEQRASRRFKLTKNDTFLGGGSQGISIVEQGAGAFKIAGNMMLFLGGGQQGRGGTAESRFL